MANSHPIWKFCRGVLLGSIVWSTLLWGINTWGVFDRARGSGADLPSATWHALGNVVVWPIVYIIVLPFVAFASLMWQARKLGWHLGKQLTSKVETRPPRPGSPGPARAAPDDPIRPR